MKNKKLLGILGITALLLAGNFAWQNAKEVDAAGKTVYLDPGAWISDKPTFWAHAWNSSTSEDVQLFDEDGDGIYQADINSENTNILFVRAASNATEIWGSKWNQSEDQLIPTNGDMCWNFDSFDGDGGNSTGHWSNHTSANDKVSGIVNGYYGDGTYTKNTVINLLDSAVNELLTFNQGFHNKASELVRITHFTKDELWMTNKEGTINSGYGTSGNNMTHFKKLNSENQIDYTVSGVGGMEGYYTTLFDLIDTANDGWVKTYNVYSSTNAEIIEEFKAIVAPCYKGFNAKSENYTLMPIIQKTKIIQKRSQSNYALRPFYFKL